MNWLLIAVVIVLAGLTVNGYRKGFIRILISFLSLIVTMVVVWFVTPYVSDFLKDHTPLYGTVKENIAEVVAELGETDAEHDGDTADGENAGDGNAGSGASVQLPSIIRNMLAQIESEPGAADGSGPQTESEAPAEGSFLEATGLDETIAAYLAGAIVNLIAFVAVFLILTLVLRFTLFTFDFIANLPVLRGVNKTAGLVLGAAEGLLVIWIGFLLLTVFAGTQTGQTFFEMIGRSSFLTWLYNHNYLLIWLLK